MMHYHVIILYLTSLCIFFLSHQAHTSVDGGFSATLIHPFSHLSPFHNSNITKEDQWNAMVSLSEDRLKYFESRLAVAPTDVLIEAPLTATALFSHLMNFSIGTPPVPALAQIDTASSLTWIQSLPCEECFPQDYPIYDPSKSSTYQMMTCANPLCVNSRQTECDSGICKYSMSYGGGGSTSSGNLAYESFSFPVKEDGSVAIERRVAFGAAHRSRGAFTKDMEGLVGLDRAEASLANQLGDTRGKFSYYMVSADQVGRIRFGRTAILRGTSTPLKGARNFYHVNLDDISVAGERLNIPPGTFDLAGDGSGGVVVDSGTPLTNLKAEGYGLLEADLLKRIPLRRQIGKFRGLCFGGTADDLESGILPRLTFHFEGGLDVDYPPSSYFFSLNDQTICMLIRSSQYSFSIFGSELQKYMHMGFNLYTRQLYMSPDDTMYLF